MAPELQAGLIGFTYYPGSMLSRCIAWFSRFGRGQRPKVSHTLIITGPESCIEAHIRTGVQHAALSKYLNDPQCRFYWKKPKGLTPEMAASIVSVGVSHIGDGYDSGLIFSELLISSALGHSLNWLTLGWLERYIASRLNSKSSEICSELVALALGAQPWLTGLGILGEDMDTINPQELYDDEFIWEAK